MAIGADGTRGYEMERITVSLLITLAKMQHLRYGRNRYDTDGVAIVEI
jgi:hypothetical protein